MNPVSIIMLSIGLAGIILYLARILDDWYKNKLTKRNMEKLPEKWVLKVIKETRDILEKWRLSQFNVDPSYPLLEKSILMNYPGVDNSYCLYSYTIRPEQTEITFQDFERLVLKKQTIPEYVECIASVNGNQNPKVGEIIKADKDGNLHGICMYNSTTYNTCFKPSNKDAYHRYFLDNLKTGEIYHGKALGQNWEYIVKPLTNKSSGNQAIKVDESKYDPSFGYMSPDSKWEFVKIAELENKKWLDSCIAANKFISKEEALKLETKYDYEVVHCTTQEEWDFVCSTMENPVSLYSFNPSSYENSGGNCIEFNSNNRNFCWRNYYEKQKDYKIYSFSEWCEKFNHKPDFMKPPSKVEAKEMTKEELLAEAKRRYPIGSKIKSVNGYTDIVKNHDDIYYSIVGTIWITGYNYNLLVYNKDNTYNSHWAEIVSKPEEVIESLPLGMPNYKQFIFDGEKYVDTKKQKGWIDPSVQTIKSINVQLVQPRKVSYF